MKIPENIETFRAYRLSTYRYSKDIPIESIPPSQNYRNSRKFFRVTRYRPQITAKRKVLWKAEAHVQDRLSLVHMPVDVSGRRTLRSTYVRALIGWNPDIQDFTPYRDVFRIAARNTDKFFELQRDKAITVMYARCSSYDTKYLTTFPNKAAGIPSNCIDLALNTDNERFLKDIDQHSYAWLPTAHTNPEAFVVLYGLISPGPGQIAGLHNKSVMNEEGISAHEKARVCIALTNQGWITNKR